MAFSTGIGGKAGRMTVRAGRAIMVQAAAFSAAVGVIEVPVVDRVAGCAVAAKPAVVGRRSMAGRAGRGKPLEHAGGVAGRAGQPGMPAG